MTEDGRPPGSPAILAVFAHPDDESLACGGTLACAADAGLVVTVLSASRGEAGSSDPSRDPSELARTRTDELQRAARILGVAETIALDVADGNIRWSEPDRLIGAIVRTIARCGAAAVITFDEDGLYWHPDHIGVHEQTTDAVRSLGSAAPALYYVSLPEGAIRSIAEAVERRGGPAASASFWGISPEAFGHAAPSPTFTVDVGAYVARKLAALRAHASQIGQGHALSWVTDDDARRWLAVECFRRAPVGNQATDILERLTHAPRHA